MLALFYPHTDRYIQLPAELEPILSIDETGFGRNLLIALDINIYNILFKLTVLGRVYRRNTSSSHRESLEHLHTQLNMITHRAKQEMESRTLVDDVSTQFWRLSYIASQVLQIFIAKVQDPTILAGSEMVRNHVSIVLTELLAYSPMRAWTGNFIWIFTILLCATYTVPDFEKALASIERFKSGMWGGDLLRLQQLVENLYNRRKQSAVQTAHCGGVMKQEYHDALAILLHPRGVLAGDEYGSSTLI